VRDSSWFSSDVPYLVAGEAAVGVVAFWQRDLAACVDTLLPLKVKGHTLLHVSLHVCTFEGKGAHTFMRRADTLLPLEEERTNF
jgi:hypothetical protein